MDFLPPSVIQTTLMKVATALSAGVIAPLRRIMHSMGTVASAFRQMIQATHVGKVVTSTRPVAEADIAVPKSMPSIAVTGGSGGLGLMISQWLVGRLGPVYLHLISRGGRITDASARSELALSCASITTALKHPMRQMPAESSTRRQSWSCVTQVRTRSMAEGIPRQPIKTVRPGNGKKLCGDTVQTYPIR